MPWSVAGDAGKLDVVYYHTDVVTDPEAAPDSAAWVVSFAQNLQATTAGSAFSTTTASPTIHFGAVCQGGFACTGNRDLLDDFGVAANPLTGLASIVYSDDQYRNDAFNKPSSFCTAADNNTVNCDHTSVATQTAGGGIFSPDRREHSVCQTEDGGSAEDLRECEGSSVKASSAAALSAPLRNVLNSGGSNGE